MIQRREYIYENNMMAEFSKYALMIHRWGKQTSLDWATRLMSLYHIEFISPGLVTQQSAFH